MKKWIDVNGIGELFLEIVLVTFDIPLLFICLDKDGNRYLVVCVDEELGQYVIAESTNKVLLAMLNNEVPMNVAFKNAIEGKLAVIQYDFKNKKFDCKYYTVNEITGDMLPDEGACFELKNKKIEDYIEKLRDADDLTYKKETYAI